MNKKENSGYVKTHQNIQKSLLALLGQKDLKKITVSDVCVLASINRSTFYAHFQDLYAVMEAIGQELEGKLTATYANVYLPNDNFMSTDYLSFIIEHIQENKTFYHALFSDSNSTILANNMKLLQSEIVAPFYQKLNVPERQGAYYFTFFRTGFVAILGKWLDDGCPESPRELAKIIFSCLPALTPEITTKFLGRDANA